MPLTVLSVAYPFAPVGPHAVGGAEQILTELDCALTVAGHTSLVLACGGSQAAGKLFTIPRLTRKQSDDAHRRSRREQLQSAMDRILASHRIDLIHMHGFDFHEYDLPPDLPVLVTLHLPIAWYPQQIWSTSPANIQFQCVSKTQRQSCPPVLRDIPVVANGVDVPASPQTKADFAIALGRICPEKNFHAALQAGSFANTRVFLAGQVFPYREHEMYFHQCIQPLLATQNGGVRHQFLGPLTPRKKQHLLACAKCLLHPTLAPETSSLVAMEALAAGTPVIAYRSGALPEIIDDGVTGFLVSSVEEIADAIHRVHTIAPEACRAAAAQRFSRERMAQDYFRLYHSLLQKPAPEPLLPAPLRRGLNKPTPSPRDYGTRFPSGT